MNMEIEAEDELNVNSMKLLDAGAVGFVQPSWAVKQKVAGSVHKVII